MLASYHLRLTPVIQGLGPRMRVNPGSKGAGEEAGAHAHPHQQMTYYLNLSFVCE